MFKIPTNEEIAKEMVRSVDKANIGLDQIDSLRYLFNSSVLTENTKEVVDYIGWPERDDLPTGDPIGDVEDECEKDTKIYVKMMKDRVINPEGKHFGTSIDFIKVNVEISKEPKCCDNPANHKKVHLITSAYKICTQCKSDLGDWE